MAAMAATGLSTRPAGSLNAALWLAIALLGSACIGQPVNPTAPAVAPAVAPSPSLPSQSLSWPDVLALPAPAAGERIAYGPAPPQFGVLRLPSGSGPHPVIALIHGGCWLAQFDYQYFEHFAQRLATAGFATWNIEYRRVGDDGGGWPGSFQDIATALDQLRVLAADYPLDLDQVITAGHSAGGHLALWAGMRQQLTSSSPLYRPEPLPLRGAIGLAPIVDLAAYRVGPAGSCHAAVDALLGGGPDAMPTRYRETSPAEALPLDLRLELISGDQDSIVAAGPVEAFAARARQAGDVVATHSLAGAGHFDLAVPTRQNWPLILRLAQELLP